MSEHGGAPAVLLDAEAKDGPITRVSRASRNHERDQPAEEWAAEFERKAKTVIDAGS
jgi:hypothetical protein